MMRSDTLALSAVLDLGLENAPVVGMNKAQRTTRREMENKK